MKVSKIVVVLAIALTVATIVVPAGAQLSPWGLGGLGCGVPFGFGACGFGAPFGTVATSSFTSTSTFSTFGAAGFGLGGCGFGVPLGLGFGGCGLGLGGFGLGGCGFGTGFGISPFGFC